MSLLIHNGTILADVRPDRIIPNASLRIEDNTIAAIFSGTQGDRKEAQEVIDASGYLLIPGFVQTHVHLCQTLFRGLADDLSLLDWLQMKIFPLEAAHTAYSMYLSAKIGIAELIRSGTTTILDMGSIHHEEEVIRAIGETGLRAFVGKAMMDRNDAYPPLRESTKDALNSTRTLAEQWHNSYGGKIKYAAAPRFALSCSDTLMHETRMLLESFEGDALPYACIGT